MGARFEGTTFGGTTFGEATLGDNPSAFHWKIA